MRVTTALCLAAAAATADGYGHHKHHKKEYKTPAGECDRRGIPGAPIPPPFWFPSTCLSQSVPRPIMDLEASQELAPCSPRHLSTAGSENMPMLHL